MGRQQRCRGWQQNLEEGVNVASKRWGRGQGCFKMNAAWSSFSLAAASICSILHNSKLLQLCVALSRGERQGCQTWAWINGQPGYFHMGWQSEPTDHRSLARRSNSRVPPVAANETAVEAKCQRGVAGGEGSEIGSEIESAINVD